MKYCFTFFANLFNDCLNRTEDSWILLVSSVFNLLQYAVLVEEHEDQASHNYVNEKERSIFIAFSDN